MVKQFSSVKKSTSFFLKIFPISERCRQSHPESNRGPFFPNLVGLPSILVSLKDLFSSQVARTLDIQDGSLLVFYLFACTVCLETHIIDCDSSYRHRFPNLSCLDLKLNKGILRSKVKKRRRKMIQFNMRRCSFKNAGIYPERLFGEEGRSDI